MTEGAGPAGFDVIVVGGLNTDYVGVGDGLPRPGETLNGTVFHETAGGKGANQAVAVARLGGRAALVGAVGADERGRVLLSKLAGEGVDVQFVRRHSDAPTGAALIHVDGRGEKQILAVLGANCKPTPSDVTEACYAIGRASVLLTQFELPLEAVIAALKWARVHGVRTVLDPAPAAASVPDDLLQFVDVLKPNAHEAEALTGIQVTDRASAAKAASALMNRGVGVVVVQAGNEGNLLVSPEGEHFFARVPVKSVDATGAGDALAATLATYLARGSSLAEAGRYANAAAAHATTKLGAQEGLPTEQQLNAMF